MHLACLAKLVPLLGINGWFKHKLLSLKRKKCFLKVSMMSILYHAYWDVSARKNFAFKDTLARGHCTISLTCLFSLVVWWQELKKVYLLIYWPKFADSNSKIISLFVFVMHPSYDILSKNRPTFYQDSVTMLTCRWVMRVSEV